MRIVHLSYVMVEEYNDPELWLHRINFFVMLLEKMSRNHHIISIHCINYTGKLRKGNVEYLFLQRKHSKFSLASKVNTCVADLRPDVIIVHGLHFPLQVLSLMQKVSRDVGIVIQHHAEKPLGHYKAILQRLIDSRISAYLFTSIEQARPWVDRRLISTRDKVFEVMEVPSVFQPIDRSKARSHTGVPSTLVYLWVGRLDDNKDPLTLIKGFDSFARSHLDVILCIVFRGGNLLNEIQEVLEHSPSKKQIKLIGEVSHSDLLYWYNSADFIVSTSHYEGSGVAVAEGISCGCIPVLTDIPSFVKMTDNKNFGAFFDPGDAEQLSEALAQALSVDIPLERQKVLAFYQNALSEDAIASGMISVCEQVNKSATK